MLERKSRTPVMPWDGMRIDEPGRGPWCENEKKKKGKEEWRRKGVAHSCYASGWHENRGTRSRTVVEKTKTKQKKRKNGGKKKFRTSVMPRGGLREVASGHGPWS